MTTWKTAKDIEKLPRHPRQSRLHPYVGGSNLYVKVDGDSRSFVLRYTSPTGKDRKMGLGSCFEGGMTVDDAIKETQKWQEVRHGTSPLIQEVARYLKIDIETNRARLWDPIEVNRILKDKARKDELHIPTFKDVMNQHYDERIARLGSSTRLQFARWIDPIVAKIGTMLAPLVTKEILLHVVGLDEMFRTKPTTADAIQGYIRAAYERADFYHGIKDNPADWEHPLAGDHQSKPHEAIPFEELPHFMAALDAYGETGAQPSVAALCFKWVVLAACRRIEACKVQWSDVAGWQTDAKPTWHVPAGKHKMGHEGDKETGDPWDCPITERMREILAEMASRYPEAAPEDYVFRSPQRSRQTAIDPTVLNGLLKRLQWPTKCTVHGFRTTFALWAENRNYPDLLIERQHIHKTEGVGGSYRHHGRNLKDATLEQRRPMMEAYGRYATQPPHSGVVEFKLKAAKS
jgi:integrase